MGLEPQATECGHQGLQKHMLMAEQGARGSSKGRDPKASQNPGSARLSQLSPALLSCRPSRCRARWSPRAPVHAAGRRQSRESQVETKAGFWRNQRCLREQSREGSPAGDTGNRGMWDAALLLACRSTEWSTQHSILRVCETQGGSQLWDGPSKGAGEGLAQATHVASAP